MTTPAWTRRFSLEGKTALVTGGTSGIGFVAVQVLADAGADIVAAGTPGHKHEDVVGRVTALGRRAVVLTADLAKPDEPGRLAREAIAAFGKIDILVNNAGIARNAPLLEATIQEWDETMAVNLRAPFLLAKAIAPQMIARRAVVCVKFCKMVLADLAFLLQLHSVVRPLAEPFRRPGHMSRWPSRAAAVKDGLSSGPPASGLSLTAASTAARW